MTREAERILVVDDDVGMRRAMQRVLEPTYRVDTSSGFAETLEKIDAHYALALIDIRLGDGDGYTLCQEVRKRCPDTEVILVTGSLSQPDEKLYRSLEEGAFYFLFKPFERRVLKALVDRCLTVRRERRAKEAYATALAEDLERARRFQQRLVPRKPVLVSGWRAEGRFEPCDELGGDLFMAIPERDATMSVGVLDVVGHGVSAAMYAGMLRSTLDAARRVSPEPRVVVEEVLRGIDFFRSSRYATLFYALLFADGKMRYVNAGHPPALWIRAGGEIVRLESTGLFLSTIFGAKPRDVGEIHVSPGERILVYSDGASEAMSPGGEELGFAGLEQSLQRTRNGDVAAALDDLESTVREHRGGRPLEDDVTLLLLHREG